MANQVAEFYLRDLTALDKAMDEAWLTDTPEAAQELLDLEAMPRPGDANSAVLLRRVLRCYTGRDASLDEVVGPKAREAGLLSLLHVVATEGYDSIALLLMEWGVDPCEVDEMQRSALHMAVARGHFGIALLLIDFGADVGARHASGKTALHFAVEGDGTDDEQFFAQLLDHGRRCLNVNEVDRIYRNTPLHLAAWNGKPKVARLLLDRGADLAARNAEGCTPAHLVSGNREMMELFIERGADLRCADARGFTPLRWINTGTVETGKLVICQLIKEEAVLGIPVGKENALLIESQPIWRRIRDECVHEISVMKSTTCYRDMTSFELFSMSVSDLTKHVKNRRLSHTLTHISYENYFPNYGPEIRSKVVKAHEAKAHMHRVAHYVRRALGDTLPHAVMSVIGEYLQPKDVRFQSEA